MVVDFDKIEKINRLARALKESKMAKTNDEAMKMAEQIIEKGEESISEMVKKQEKEIKKESFVEKLKEKAEGVEEKLHIKKKEPEKEG